MAAVVPVGQLDDQSITPGHVDPVGVETHAVGDHGDRGGVPGRGDGGGGGGDGCVTGDALGGDPDEDGDEDEGETRGCSAERAGHGGVGARGHGLPPGGEQDPHGRHEELHQRGEDQQ